MLIIIHIEINYVNHDTDGLIFMIDEQHRTADRVVIMLNIARGVREHMQEVLAAETMQEADRLDSDRLQAVARCTDQLLREMTEPGVLADDFSNVLTDEWCLLQIKL